MTDHEPTIHFPKGIDQISFQMFTDQTTIDGLNALIHWLQGYAYAKKGEGRIPGHFDLIMHYRQVVSGIAKAINDEKKEN